MKLLFHPEAETELFAAIEYYEQCAEGLGYDFSIEIHSTLQNIVAHPSAWPTLEEDVRRCLVNRFPYGVLYSIESDSIFILAVMPLHRLPDCWKSRQEK
jgi:hypothetical protein